MHTVQLEGLYIHHDPQSGGYWLERDQLSTLAEHHQSHIEEIEVGERGERVSDRVCPKDGAALVELEFGEHSGIKVDCCPTCQGLWLDGGELQKITSYLESHPYGVEIEEPENDDDVPLTDRMMMFLYQLTARPPYV